MNNIDLSIIIVHYKTPDLLLECVKSVWNNSSGENIEVIVVDNDSKDNSEELISNHCPLTKWINAGYNSGFARANNIGIRCANGNFILLLNPDTYVAKGFLSNMLNKYKDIDKERKLGLLGCRIISSVDKTLLVGSGLGFPSLLKFLNTNPVVIKLFGSLKNKKKYEAEIMHYKNHKVDYVSGACVMIEKSKVLEFDLFLDEDFFLYYEDVEWSFRSKKHGLFNYFNGEAEVYHVNSASTNKETKKRYTIVVSEWLFFFKTLSSFQFWLMNILVSLNYSLNKMILKRRGQNGMLKEEEKYIKMFKHYTNQIRKQYTRKPSSGKFYLAYVE